MMDFLSQSIKEKEEHLECPVCLETAEAPIYMCQEMHLICSNCRPKLGECPMCQAPYQAQLRRHRSVVNTQLSLGSNVGFSMDPHSELMYLNIFYRYAERTADELKKLREELAKLATPEI